jgi:hypothetical protein
MIPSNHNRPACGRSNTQVSDTSNVLDFGMFSSVAGTDASVGRSVLHVRRSCFMNAGKDAADAQRMMPSAPIAARPAGLTV